MPRRTGKTDDKATTVEKSAPEQSTPRAKRPAKRSVAPTVSTPVPDKAQAPGARVAGLREHLSSRGDGQPQSSIDAAPAEAGARSDALDRLLDRLGGLRMFHALRSMDIERELSALDHRGRVLFSHSFRHRAKLGVPGQDTIDWSRALHYGRKGGLPWVRSSGIDRPDLEERAGAETDMWAMLLRFPFGLRDRSRYIVEPVRTVTLLGKPYRRVRVLERAFDPRRVPIGPVATDDRARRHGVDIYVDPDTELPAMLEVRKGVHGRRRIMLAEWRRLGDFGPLVPRERTFLAEDGESPSLVVRWRELSR